MKRHCKYCTPLGWLDEAKIIHCPPPHRQSGRGNAWWKGGRLHRLEVPQLRRRGGVVHVGRRHVNALVDQRGDALAGLDVLQHRDDLLEQSGLLRRADLLRHGVVGLDVHWVGLGRVDLLAPPSSRPLEVFTNPITLALERKERETERKRFVEGQWSFFFFFVVVDRGSVLTLTTDPWKPLVLISSRSTRSASGTPPRL